MKTDYWLYYALLLNLWKKIVTLHIKIRLKLAYQHNGGYYIERYMVFFTFAFPASIPLKLVFFTRSEYAISFSANHLSYLLLIFLIIFDARLIPSPRFQIMKEWIDQVCPHVHFESTFQLWLNKWIFFSLPQEQHWSISVL